MDQQLIFLVEEEQVQLVVMVEILVALVLVELAQLLAEPLLKVIVEALLDMEILEAKA
jgi:hypothetical protein